MVSDLSYRGADNDTVDFDTDTLIIPSPDPVNGSEKDNDANLPRKPSATKGVYKSKATNSILDLNGTSSNHRINGPNGASRVENTSTMADSSSILEDITEGDGKAPPPIAIVGMGMRLPGGVNGEKDFWDLLINKKNGRGVVPKDRYNIDAFYSANGGPGTVKTKHGYFLEHVDLQHLDTSFFSMNKSEVEKLDPQQRLLLEVIWECMDNGGQVGWRGKNIGCYVGVFGEDWLDMAAKDTQHLGMYRITGSGDFAISNRVSYEYNLKGPSMTIRTGCSSSLIGLHEACQAIYSGECHSAIVAGTNLIMTPTMTIAMTEQGVLSPTGLCMTFDAKADGYARAEAINAVYIKKLSDAINDGDPIRAVIRATTTNCDGKTPGMACPSSESHELMIRRAYKVARLPLSGTAFVECHGTGTAVGDPLETSAVANVFGRDGIFIGSVKPNVGHSEGASGITSLIKTVLALEHRVIPPNINFDEPNPKIPFESARLQVPLVATPWPEHRERASVNSFGIGGANAHVVVDSAASFGIRSSANIEKCSAQDRPHLLVFSANHPKSLTSSLEEYQQLVARDPHLLKDLAHTLGARKEHLPHRAYCVMDGKAPFEISTLAKSKSTPKVVFVFTGQGAQWAGMAKQLLEDFAEFRNDIKAMDNVLAGLPTPPSWTIERELAEGEGSNRIDEAEFSQPLCTAVQIALVNLLRGWGVSPAAVVGHSSGEIAAACTSNAITAKSAIIIAYYRGQVCRKQLSSGGMLAVGMGWDVITPYLIKGVVVACENSPESVTLSGDKEQINKIAARIADEQPDVFVRQLKVGMPYHSYHMEQVGAEYYALLTDHVPTEQMELPFFSSVTGKTVSDSRELGPSYWRQNLESPVLFSSATRALLGQLSQGNVFLEIGPHSALAGPLRQIFKAVATAEPQVYVPSLIRAKNCTRSLLSAVGQMHLLRLPINFEVVTPGKTVLTNLPTYPWNHETRYWNESRTTREWRTRRFPKHELLGSRILEGNELEPTWRSMVRLEDVPWIQDHMIINDVVFPAAGYITMAGEAVRQLTERNDFTLRNVLIRTALVFQDSKTTEMMTSLRSVQLTTTLSSDWYEVVISSYNGTSWIKHFTCQARAGQDQAIRAEHIEEFSREVPASAWYSAMRRIGLNYGPAFQGLSNISASPQRGTSVANLLNQHGSADSSYELHPTVIDSCLQLFTVAMSGGIARHLQKLCVPTEIEELYVRQGIPEMRVKVVASSSTSGTIMGDAVATAGNEVVIQLKGGKFSPLEDQAPSDVEDPIAGAQLDWKPDISFMRAENLMRPRVTPKEDIGKLEMLALLCILETHHQLSQCETKAGHLKKFYDWLNVQKLRAKSGTYPVIEEEAQRLAHLSHEERLESIGIAKIEVENSIGAGVGKTLLRILEHCKAIFVEQVDSIEILVQDNGLKILYDFFQDMWDCQAFFELLGHAKPTLRILEIGAGTGGMTACALKNLVTRSGERMYSQYCYTDVSAGFFVAAKERFKDFHNLQYAVLDISKDPMEQGFEAESYDLILASNVLHATPSINSTLRNVRKLLHPQGRLLLQELTPTLRVFNYIMGILPGWWFGENDDRPFEPYISVGRWDSELHAAGFSGTDSVVYDSDLPYQINVNILSSPAETRSPANGLTLLCEDSFSPIARQIGSMFVRQGYRVDFSSIDQIPPENQDIISLLDLSTPFFDKIASKELGAFQRYIGNLKSSGVLWATRSSQIGCNDPRYSQVLGLARTIRSELLVDFATFEIDTIDDFALEALSNVFAKFHRRAKDPQVDPDWEFALFEGVIHTPRYHWTSVAKQLAVISEEEHPHKLEVEKTGLLQSLRWVQGTPIVLTEDQLEVETRAVGLNFKDILVCMGVVDAAKDGIGLEGAGVVRRLGSEVKDFKVGDRVIMFDHGCFSTRLAISAKLCAKIPEELSFEEAATLPCVYSTVIHSLLTIGRLEKGQTVLVQSACGGVGLAAIQICKMIGAQIFATVGNDDKAQYLVRTFDIARHRIFNSRNTSFLADVMRETNGRGVDIVLNSLSGELLHTSWRCVAEYGKMLEIGKRDFIGRGMLSMDLFEANRAFFGIDLARLGVERPEACRNLLEQCMKYHRHGAIGPIKPMKVFDAIRIVDAFKYMQKGQHIGKIVVTMPKSPQELSVTAVKQDFHLRPEKSYLLVGGLGGLGRAISTWMVERGARNLIFLSRSAGQTKSDKKFFCELETQGCLVQAFCGSVTRLEDVQNAVQNTVAPLAGVLHMSMVLKDRGFLEFSHDDWHTAVAPKVEGAWNLHKALLGEELDFFVLFSSLSCAVGQRGQGNYTAANAFLNSFVQYRQGLGQPASAIDIGVMEDVGYVSQNPAVLEQLKAQNAHTLREQDLIDTLQLVMTKCTAPPPSAAAGYRNPTQLVIGLRSTKPLSDPSNRSIWKRDVRMSLYRNLETSALASTGPVNEALKHFLATVAREPSMLNEPSNVSFLTHEIGARLCNLMLQPDDDVDVKQSLMSLGLDSLVAIEIRNWWRQCLGLEISVLEIMNSGSIEQLGKTASEGLLRKYEVPGTAKKQDTYLLMKAP